MLTIDRKPIQSVVKQDVGIHSKQLIHFVFLLTTLHEMHL